MLGRLFLSPLTSTIHASEKELTKIFQQEHVCPDCGVWDFLSGSEGGGSINILCGNCGSLFNEMGPFGISRIYWIDINISVKNYREFNRDIIKKWTKIIIRYEIPNTSTEIYKWCENNINELWSVKWGGDRSYKTITYYFKLEEDALAFKLRWI